MSQFSPRLRAAYVLRTMLFSMPVHVAAFSSIGVPFSEIVRLEGISLLAASITQVLGAYINDRFSPRIAFALGKAIAAFACILLAIFQPSSHLQLALAFGLWGAGIGMFDGSDFLSALGSAKVRDQVRRVEQLGLVGSLASFAIGSWLFKSGGFKALFLANAAASLGVVALLMFRRDESGVAQSEKKSSFRLSEWASGLERAPIASMLAYAGMTILLKMGMLQVQESLRQTGLPTMWNGLVFMALTFAAMGAIRLSVRGQLISLLVAAIGCAILQVLPGSSAIAMAALTTTTVLFIRTSHRLHFFSEVVERSPRQLVGRNTSLAQMIAGLGLASFGHASSSTLVTGAVMTGLTAFITLLALRNVSLSSGEVLS